MPDHQIGSGIRVVTADLLGAHREAVGAGGRIDEGDEIVLIHAAHATRSHGILAAVEAVVAVAIWGGTGLRDTAAADQTHHRIAHPIVEPQFQAGGARGHGELIGFHLSSDQAHRLGDAGQRRGPQAGGAECAEAGEHPAAGARANRAGVGWAHTLADHCDIIIARDDEIRVVARQHQVALRPGFLHGDLAVAGSPGVVLHTIPSTGARRAEIGHGAPAHRHHHFSDAGGQGELPTRRVGRNGHLEVGRLARGEVGDVSRAAGGVIQVRHGDALAGADAAAGHRVAGGLGSVAVIHPHVVGARFQRAAHGHDQALAHPLIERGVDVIGAPGPVHRAGPTVARGPGRAGFRRAPVAARAVRQQIPPHHQLRRAAGDALHPQIPAQHSGWDIDALEFPPARLQSRNGGIAAIEGDGGGHDGMRVQSEQPQRLQRRVNAHIPDVRLMARALEKAALAVIIHVLGANV